MSTNYPEPPVVLPIMLQRWHEIAFLHWSADPDVVAPRLPTGLQVDTFGGKAWISLTPFLLQGLRPPLTPRILGMTFPEMNLRTYVIGARGRGIWFFSLDAGQWLAVVGARAAYGLPYYWADMGVDIGKQENNYFSNRGGRVRAKIRIQKEEPIFEQSALDIFLTARFRLYLLGGRLLTSAVHHAPWKLNRASVLNIEENVRQAMGVGLPSDTFLVHHSEGVDTRIGPPQPVS